MRVSLRSFAAFVAFSSLTAAAAAACGGVSSDSFPVPDAVDDDGGSGGDGRASSHRDSGTKDAGCQGTACQQTGCTADDPAAETTISGTVYMPNGVTPLYNAIVFVPTSTTPLAPLPDELTCDKCGTVAGSPVTITTTDADGHFTLHNAPAGSAIPLVVQLGKWRRQVVLPTVTKCTDNPITDPNVTRLPKNHSEGDMPHIAITMGQCDTIACMLPKIGVDSAEYGTAADIDTKRIIFYSEAGSPGPAGMTAASTLFSDESTLKKFDAVVLSCNCTLDGSLDNSEDGGDPSAFAHMADYMSLGGRVLSIDFQYAWTESGPMPQPNVMQGFVGGAPYTASSVFTVDHTYPKGAALEEWLKQNDPTHGYTGGSLTVSTTFANFGHVDPTLAQGWVTNANNDLVMSYTMPLAADAANRCGKMTYFDGHVLSTEADSVSSTYPVGCSSTFTQQSAMYGFFFMDMFGCVQDETKPVIAPH